MYSKRSITVCNQQKLAYRKRSRSVSCHAADVTFSPFPKPIRAGTQFCNPGWMQGWVVLVGWLHTEVIYPPADVTTMPNHQSNRNNLVIVLVW